MKPLRHGWVLPACMLCMCLSRPISAALFDREGRKAFVANLRPEERERLVELKSRAFLVTPVAKAHARSTAKQEVYVMFRDAAVSKQVRARLEAKGARTLDYVTGHTWRMELPDLALLAGEGGVLGIEPVRPEDKLSPIVWRRAAGDDVDTVMELVVHVTDDATADAAVAAVKTAGGVTDDTRLGRWRKLTVRMPVGTAAALAAHSIVRYIEPPPPPNGLDNRVSAAVHNVDDLWVSPYGLTGAGITVMVRDSYVEPHRELGDRLIIVDEDDPGSHGMHVCGIIGARGTFDTNAIGMAPRARIVSYSNDFFGYPGEIEDALDDYGARLSNHSYGPDIGWTRDDDEWDWDGMTLLFGAYDFSSMSTDSMVHDLDVIICRSAGNHRGDTGDGSEPPDGSFDGDGRYDCMSPPPCSKNVIAVGAVDSNLAMTAFSSWGPAYDGRIKPDIVAKGQETWSLDLNDGYSIKQGTSMSSPTVCGATALLLQYYAAFRNGFQPSAALVKALLLNTTVDLFRPGPDYQSGWGSLNIKKAVDMVHEESESYNVIRTGEIEEGEVHRSMIMTEWATNLQITLVWMDAAGGLLAENALVNDLDLVALAPDGTNRYPYVMPYAQVPGASRTNTAIRGVNTKDNVEQIQVHCAPNGAWLLDIHGTSVPDGPQRYALVAHADQLPERFEPNDTFETAAYIGVGPGFHLRGMSLHCQDKDYYRFRLVRPCYLTFTLHGVFPFGMSLYDAHGAHIEDQEIPFGSTNVLMTTPNLPAGSYYLKVWNTSIDARVEPYALDVEPTYHSRRVYYVNSPAVTDPTINSFYTLAPGSDANDGRSPYTPKATVASVLAAHDLAAPDLVVIDTGTYTDGAVITPDDEGIDYAGTVVGSRFNLDETVFPLNNVEGNRFYHMHFVGDGMAFDLANADHNRFDSMVVTNDNTGIRIADDGGSPSESNIVVTCAFTNDGTAVLIENSPDTLVASNRFDGSGLYGVQLVSGWSNTVLDNVFLGKSYAVHITDGDHELIKGNRVDGGGTYGIYVDQAEKTVMLNNHLLNRTYGAYITGVSGNEAEVLLEKNVVQGMLRGIYLAGDYTEPSEVVDNWVSFCTDIGIHSKANGNIHDNHVRDSLVGIRYDGAARGAYDNALYRNTTGLSGSGLLGGASWASHEPNHIESNTVGIAALSGATVQFNRVYDNTTGIDANHAVSIHHNVIYRNEEQGIRVNNDHVVSIVNNTVYNPTGDCVRVTGASRDVSLYNNILWSAGGYGLYVAADSQVGFASDYNNFFTSGSGKLVWWQKDFTDLLDWQVEANLDNHSIGVTVVNPTLDDPLFLDALGGDFRLGVGSTSIDAGDLASPFSSEPGSNGNRINLGAYGGTAAAAGSPALFVTLIYPQYYTDWPAYEVRSIQWTNVGLTGDADIDLYREGAGKIADLATVPLAGGSYSWNPAASTIQGNTTNRYRIRVTAAASPSHCDESREPFSIPISGADYYVNDDSVINGQYCTAIGGNRQTGMTTGDPKANVIGTLRSYALGPGDTVWVDHGYYLHVRNVTISASPGLGDDEGMVLAGPTAAFKEALIDRGNPFEEATTFDLNDADYVTMRDLTLTGGNLGILLRNGSDSFNGSHLSVNSNSLDGIRIEAGAAASVLSQLTVFDNGEDGISATTPIGTFSNCAVYGNGKVGIDLYASGDTTIEGCWVRNNDVGIRIENEVEGTRTVLGRADLGAQRGNRVFDNETDGIHAHGYVSVVGNTVTGQDGTYGRGVYLRGTTITSAWNVVHGNTDGIVTYAFTGTIEHNRVYNNAGWGIDDDWPGGLVRRNVVYSNDGGIQGFGNDYYRGTIANNVVYANTNSGIRIARGSLAVIENNTVRSGAGTAVEVVDGSVSVKLRNNILWAGGGAAIHVDLTSEAGFGSDYNLFLLTGSGYAGRWQTTERATLTDWKNATFGDASSFAALPRFVDVDGADEVMGGANGEDDDFHVRSPHGSFHGGSHAPLHGGGVNLPTYAMAVETADAEFSAAIDRGDGTYAYTDEPAPNGGFINIGAYGNTEQASKSPTEYVTVLSPSGGESWPAEQSFLIRWRSQDTNSTVSIELFNGAVSALVITAGTPNDGEFLWQVPSGLTPSANYTLVVTRSGGSTPSGTSLAFAITGAVNTYYVNDGSNNVAYDWTTAPGDDANDGLTPATPKATVRGVLEAYDLGPGDVIKVDNGDYVLSQVLLVTSDDSGVKIEGYHDEGLFWRRALLDRNNSSSSAVELNGADDVELVHLDIVGGQRGIYAYGDSDRLRVQGCFVCSNDTSGITVQSGCDDAVITGNRLYGYPGGASWTDDQDRCIEVMGDGAKILGNYTYDAGNGSGYGIYAQGEGLLIEGNEAYRSFYGIQVSGQGSTTTVVRQNTCYSNTLIGLSGGGNVRVEANTCYGHTSSSLSGISVSGDDALAIDNVCHHNDYGIRVADGAHAEANRVYTNRWGIYVYYEGTARGNRAYSNQRGIYIQGGYYPKYKGVIDNNVVYANAVEGIRMENAQEGAVLRNNTVYEESANAIVIAGQSSDVVLRNNILHVFEGAAIVVDGTAQDGFDSDYNLFDTIMIGRVGEWDGEEFFTRAKWFFELGQDEHSWDATPYFVDKNGPDDKLGFDSATGMDYGVDDNFHLQSQSWAIDRGEGYYLEEPRPNGGRINLGAYGNTPEATTSPDKMLQVLDPNGLEKFEVGQMVNVQWRSAGFTPTGYVARINVAGETEGRWLYSRYQTESYGTSSSYGTADLGGVSNAAPHTVYQYYAGAQNGVGNRIAWFLPVPDGSYTLRLHFVETGYSSVGDRQFDIMLQGAVVAPAFDILAAAGSTYKAVAPRFPVTATGGAGISIVLVNQTSPGAILSAIELLAANPVGPLAQTVNVAYSANNGGSWSTIASGVPFDVEGEGTLAWSAGPATSGNTGLIRVQGGGVTELIEDASDYGFSVAAAGSAYYINDEETPGDTLTTAAGNDLNSGRAPGAPMASLSALLNAYDLDPGDTVYVDHGSYTTRVNIVIGTNDAGVRIEGPAVGAPEIDRDNVTSSSSVFELIDADDVELVDLRIVGGYRGIEITEDSDGVRVQDCTICGNKEKGISTESGCDDVVVTGNHLYGITGGSYDDNQRTGIDLRGDGGHVLYNTIQNGDLDGVYVFAGRALIHGNTIFGFGQGIEINGRGDDNSIIQANTCRDNTYEGIYASGRCRVLSNTCYGQDGYSGKGIKVDGANTVAIGNTVYGNKDGIYVSASRAEANRVYNNSAWGIYVQTSGDVKKNHIYSNEDGVYLKGQSYTKFVGMAENNRIYANAGVGLRLEAGGSETVLRNNTIYEAIGNALELTGETSDVLLRDNILCVDGGIGLHVAGSAQAGLDCDYNLYHATGTGLEISWDGTIFTNWLAWTLELGHDRHSRFADPLFADADGADDVLGYDEVEEIDRGQDDDFHVGSSSHAVDGGDPLSYHLEEPLPSGDRNNIGAYGNTAEATLSPVSRVQVLYPNGYEKLELGESVDVTWHTAGVAPFRTAARINAGGATEKDWLYDRYQAHTYELETSGDPVDVSAVSNPAPEMVYQQLATAEGGVSNRLGWTLPVPDGEYALTLHFVEPWYDWAGARMFDIVLQGNTVVSNYDIHATAGAEDKAVTESFAVTAQGGSGISVQMMNRTWEPALLCALELTSENAGGLDGAAVDVDVAASGTNWVSIATNVALAADGGGNVAWSAAPVTSGNTARVRVTVRSPAPMGTDTSDHGFLIGSGGTRFYVNDDSIAGDQYTSSVGDNTMDGRTPATPMSSPIALLAAYDLGFRDTVYIDTGHYLLAGNMVVGAQDKGVWLRGATQGVSLLNRGNAVETATCIELDEAPYVRLYDLHVTGGYRGIHLKDGSTNVTIRGCTVSANTDCGIELDDGSDEARIEDSTLYGIGGGGADDDQDTGIRVFADHVDIVNNLIHDGDVDGIDFYAEGGNIASNTVFGYQTGIDVTGDGVDITHVHHNTVHHNDYNGIDVIGRAHVTDNVAYGHTASGRAGVYVYGVATEARRNVCYDNHYGIHVRKGIANDNRVFYNSGWGIQAYEWADVKRNKVYSNDGGIWCYYPSRYQRFHGRIENNVVYDNANDGVKLETCGPDAELVNNTIYTPVGNAVKVAGYSWAPVIRNNILWIDAGYCVYVESVAQSAFDCDYNVLYHGLDPNARVGYWGNADQDGLATWQSASAGDANTVFGHPKPVKRDGADGVLGYSTAGEQDVDGGEDDNFHLAIFSPAIDAADEPPAPLLDAEGNGRMDDATIPNRGTGSGIVEIGAYEFLGNSRDTNGPVVTATVPAGVHSETTVNTALMAVEVLFSKVLDSIDAVAPANYELVFDSDESTTFDETDTVYELMPVHIGGSMEVTLFAPAGPLPNGLYQLAIQGTGVHDVAGIALDGDYDSSPGGDYVRVFTVMDSGFALGAEPVVTGGGSIQLLFAVQPGFDYYVQYRDSLTGLPGWQDAPGGPHNTGAVQDDPPPDVTGRFYRIRRVPQ